MRKILSFLMMALFSVSMFAATDTLYVWDGNGSTTAAIQKGGTAEAIQTTGTNIVAGASQKGNWCFKVNKGFTNGEYYIGIALDKGVNAGDIINIGYFRTTASSTYVMGIDFSADKASAATTYQILSKGDPQVLTNNGVPVDSTFVVPEGVSNAKYIRIYRNSGSTGTWVSKFVVKRESSDPEPTTKTLYLKPGVWAADNAKFGVYYFVNNDDNGFSDIMTQAENETDVYTTTIPAKYSKVIFIRLKNTAITVNWSDKWDQSADLTIPDGKDLYTVTGWNAGDGEWSKYVAPTPAEDVTLYLINNQEWETPKAYVFVGGTPKAEWPGEAMTKTEDKVNGFDVYSYTFKDNFTSIIFNDGAAEGTIQTADLAWDKAKPYFVPGAKNEQGKFEGTWYATKEDIPAPAVPLEGNIWKVTEETPLVAGSHYIDEALLKMDGVFATTLKPNARTIAGEEFTHAIQVRNAAYPSAEAPAGTENSGSTSLVITAKENVDVTFFYARQEGDKAENDSKDLIIFDQAGFSKLTGEFSSEADNNEGWLKATKKVVLWKDHVYTVSAKGTTLQLHGVKLEAHVPAMQIAGQWEIKDDAWVINNMVLAQDKKTASYKVELAKGDYEFKVLKDGAWLTKANDGAYGLHREWTGVAGVTDDAANNLKVSADAAGEYIFTWTFENDSIGITFPDPEPAAKFYITGTAALVGEELTWNPAAIKSTEDSYELSLKAGQEYRMKITVDGTWDTAKGIKQLTERAAGLIDMNENIGFSLKEDGKVKVTYTGEVFKLEGNFVETPIVKTYFATTSSWAEDAESNVVVNEDKSITVNIVKSKEAAWQAQIHYQAPVAKAGKLYDLSVKFKATNAINNVIVKYMDNVEMTFDNEIALEKDVELAYSKTDLVGKDGGNGILVFDFGFAPANTVVTISGITITEKDAPEPVELEDGFYLIGKIGGVAGWDESALKAANKFAPNLENPVEFMLNVTLAEGDEIQVVNVLNNAITAWFPGGEGNNFVIDAAHAGEKTIFFRPDKEGGEDWWHGCIYIAPNTATAISNTVVEGKAQKMIISGQLFILRDGKTYTVQGLQVR